MEKKMKKLSNKKMKKSVAKGSIGFPQSLLRPVAIFLQARLKSLEKQKKGVDKEDPFKVESRVGDNASPDTDAAEQYGHARTSALREQIDRKIIQTRKALTMVKVGKYGLCEDCGKMIDTDRLMIYPEATFCISCERKREK